VTAIGWVDGEPVPRAVLDERIRRARQGRRSAALPAAGTAEDRQFQRWLTQVILVETVCAAEATRRGLCTDSLDEAGLAAAESAAFGSIAAAAYQGSAAVRAVFADVSTEARVDEGDVRRYWAATARSQPPRFVLRHRRDGRPAQTIGPVPADALPASIAAGLAGARASDMFRVADALGQHEIQVLTVEPETRPDFDRDSPPVRALLLDSARREAFGRWLDAALATRVRTAPGLEHPGDPRQPDNHHQH
jgi:[acyl-carrier-protein] S-malonyltransferase